MLRRMADVAFGEGDPTAVMYKGRAHTVSKEGDGYMLDLRLPFAQKSELEMFRAGEELVVRVGNQRRNIILPRALLPLEVKDAKFSDGLLRVRFG